MPPKLYRPWLAIVLCAAVALVAFEASARNPSRCLTLRYDEDIPADIMNDCSECRRATIRRCDGTRFTMEVEGSAWDRVPGSFGCEMEKTAESRCTRHRSRHPSRKSRRRAAQIKKNTASIASTPRKSQLKPSDDRQTIPSGQPAIDRGTGAGVSVATNSMQAANEPVESKLAAVPRQKDTLGALARIKAKTRTQMVAFPDLSEHDWGTLLCSESGQSLVTETKALLDRRAVLQIVLGELWFSSDAVEKQEEWFAAEREMLDINRKLHEFHDGAIAVVSGK